MAVVPSKGTEKNVCEIVHGPLYPFPAVRERGQESGLDLAKRASISNLLCKCGHVIRDYYDFVPYKGEVRQDQDLDESFETACNQLALLVAAVAKGRRDEWISRHFLPGYPRSAADNELISDFVSGLEGRTMSTLYEREVCGRLWVQKQPGVNAHYSYTPDSNDINRVLTSAWYAHDKSGLTRIASSKTEYFDFERVWRGGYLSLIPDVRRGTIRA